MFGPPPKWLKGIPAFTRNTPYVATKGSVYASDSINAQIAVFSPEGEALDPLSSSSLLRPYGMAISADGLQMLVTDGLANAVIPLSLAPD